MSMLSIALQVNTKDNVATVFANGIRSGTQVELRDKAGNASLLTVQGNVPYGHKVAVGSIAKGASIVKYGEEIGVASRPIQHGEYVHTHNLDSMRGRGDLPEEGGHPHGL